MLHRKKILTYTAVFAMGIFSVIAFQNCGGSFEANPPIFMMKAPVDSQGSTAQASTAQASTAQASTAQGSTAQGSTAQGSTAQGSTAQGSTAQGSTAQASSGSATAPSSGSSAARGSQSSSSSASTTSSANNQPYVQESTRYTDAIAKCAPAVFYPPESAADIVSGKDDLYLQGEVSPPGSKVVGFHWGIKQGPSGATIVRPDGGSTAKVQNLKYGIYVFTYTLTYLVRPDSEIARESTCTQYVSLPRTDTDWATYYNQINIKLKQQK